MKWVTRERPKIDRIACPWLIARYIDKSPEFLYVPGGEVMQVAADTGALPYDVPGVELGHHGDQCSFDAFIAKYELKDDALKRLALIVRAADGAKGAVEADALARALRTSAAGGYRVLGPAHAPLARLRREHRFQILLKGHRPAMRDAVKAALVARYGPQRWPGVAVDVDPLTVM